MKLPGEVWLVVLITVAPLTFIQGLHLVVHDHINLKTEEQWLETLDPDIQSLIKNRSYK